VPDVDGAHGFLTALLPLHRDPCPHPDHGGLTSPAHAVREVLASLPAAQHSPSCVSAGLQSPFARSPVTHFARFAVIDDPAFNGRDTQDAILTAANVGPDLMSEPAVDVLGRTYLLFCADFDVPAGSADPVDDYLRDLWTRMPAEWLAILEHCEGWRTGAGVEGFAAYIGRCQVETTMPFNDYPVTAGPPASEPVRGVLILAGVAGVAAALLTVLAFRGLSIASVIAALAAGVVVAAGVALWTITRRGRRRTPWTPGTDLATILKALHVQAAFTRFAIDQQGAAPAELQAAFRAFLAAERPDDLASPTQPPGVVPTHTGLA
jgi:hypothetical protein